MKMVAAIFFEKIKQMNLVKNICQGQQKHQKRELLNVCGLVFQDI